LDSFHTRCRWRILHIRWYDYISNDEVLCQCGLLVASSIVHIRWLGLFGHIVRLPDDVLANQILWTCCEARDGVLPSPDSSACSRSTSHYLDSSDPPGHWNTGDWCSGAGRWQIVLVTNHYNGLLLLIKTSRRELVLTHHSNQIIITVVYFLQTKVLIVVAICCLLN